MILMLLSLLIGAVAFLAWQWVSLLLWLYRILARNLHRLLS
jgi:hypothetical protein